MAWSYFLAVFLKSEISKNAVSERWSSDSSIFGSRILALFAAIFVMC